MRIDRRELAGGHPGADHFGFARHQVAQLAIEFVAQERRALDHLEAEQARGIGLVARDHQLAPDVVADRLPRVLLGAEAAQRLQPHGEQLAQHRDVELLLVGEVVEQVAFRDIRTRCDLVDAGAVQAEAREEPERRAQDRRALVLDLAQPPVHRRDAARHGRALRMHALGWRRFDGQHGRRLDAAAASFRHVLLCFFLHPGFSLSAMQPACTSHTAHGTHHGNTQRTHSPCRTAARAPRRCSKAHLSIWSNWHGRCMSKRRHRHTEGLKA